MNELLWYASRATGIVSVVLMTAVVVLGMTTAGRRRPHGTASAVVMAVHRGLSLGMSVFLLVHIVTAAAESYVDIGWISTVVPFTSGYAPWQVGLGTLALDLLVTVVATSLLRHRLPERTWRTVHWLAYALWPLSIVHGFALATPDQPGLRAVTIACAVTGIGAVGWRLSTSYADRDRRELVAAQEWS